MRKIIILLAVVFAINPLYAQRMSKFRLPSPESATYDNNGKDLMGFIKRNKADMMAKGDVVSNATSGTWGYIQYENVKVPAIDRKGNLNYSESFDIALAISNSTSPAKATWWAREYNSAKGKLTWYDRSDDNNTGLTLVKYDAFVNEINTKKIALIEYIDTVPNLYDFDDMYKNCLFVKKGAIANTADYSDIVKYYNNFIEKFTTTTGAFITGSFFMSSYKLNGNEYVVYMDVINNKLTGNLVKLDAPFENDRIKFVNSLLYHRHIESVYYYGEDHFGLYRLMKKRVESSNFNPITFKKINR